MTEANLRFPAVFCENLRFSAKICGFLRFPAPSKCWNFQEKGRICENLRFSAKICVLCVLCHLSSVTLSAFWNSLESLETDFSEKTLFAKDPSSRNPFNCTCSGYGFHGRASRGSLGKGPFYRSWPDLKCNSGLILGAQRLTRSGLNGVSERDFGKTSLPFPRLIKVLYQRGENCLQNAHFYKQKGPC